MSRKPSAIYSYAAGSMTTVPEEASSIPLLLKLEKRVQDLQTDVQKAGYRPITAEERDLLVLSAAIAYADRCSVRSNTRWERTIQLYVAVGSPNFQDDPGIKNKIMDCLRELTGDLWLLKFVPSRNCKVHQPQSPQLSLTEHEAVIPYSGGLDSLATFRVLNSLSPDTAPMAVPLAHRNDILKQIRNDQLVMSSLAKAKLHLGAGKHPEPTFRARNFLFLALATVAARLRGVDRIVIPESGQGAIGAWMTAIGDEPPPCGSHPYFTHSFQTILDALWPGAAPRIEHPNLWKTKAELLAQMRELDANLDKLNNVVADSRSCSRADRMKGGKGRHCGLCPNCLLRRVSLVNGGFEAVHRKENYVWKNLRAKNLAGALAQDLKDFAITDRHEEVARSAVIVHRDFARMADDPSSSYVMDQARLLESALNIPLLTVKEKLFSLLARHQAEWSRFLAEETSDDSWVRVLYE